MILYLLLGSLLGAFAVFFAMENNSLLTVHFLSWSFTAPSAIMLISAVVLGILITLVALLPQAIKSSMDSYAAQREKRRTESKEFTVVAQ